jgi:hypothetical protein
MYWRFTIASSNKFELYKHNNLKLQEIKILQKLKKINDINNKHFWKFKYALLRTKNIKLNLKLNLMMEETWQVA